MRPGLICSHSHNLNFHIRLLSKKELPGQFLASWKTEERGKMNKTNVKIVGTKENPISVYWDVKNRKTDEYLLLLSICSGAYDTKLVDKELFFDLCKRFFRYAKKSDKYKNQLLFVLNNGDEECVSFLDQTLFEKWNIELDYGCSYDQA